MKQIIGIILQILLLETWYRFDWEEFLARMRDYLKPP